MLRLSDNPPMLPPAMDTIEQFQGTWWVAHTKSRFEKAFAWDMLNMGIAYFLPMTKRVRFSGGRKRRILVPLFTGYVFLCGREEHRYAALRTNRLCRTIEVVDQKRLTAELVNIETTFKGKARLQPYPFAVVGQRCRVTAGPFEGLEGVVVRSSKQALLVLQVRVLGQAASMEIDCDLIEPAAS